MNKYNIKPIITFLLVFCLSFSSVINPIGIKAAEEPVVTLLNNGSRLVADIQNIDNPQYQWYISDTTDGAYSPISEATNKYYDIKTSDEGKFIKVIVSGTSSSPTENAIGKLVVFDVSKDNVNIGTNYSGLDIYGATISGTHANSNIYVITQENYNVATENKIAINSDETNYVFDITISGVNMTGPITSHKTPNSRGYASYEKGVIDFVNAASLKHNSILRIKDENIVRAIHYSTKEFPGKTLHESSLKITDINGDGETNGGSLYIPVKKVSLAEINDFVNSTTSYNHWNSGIGGDDGSYDRVTNFEIAGGTIQVLTTYADNCTAIGAGGNGHCDMTISGGKITAHASGTGTAIGGGIGWFSSGGSSDIRITGGDVYAKNHGKIYVKVARNSSGKATSSTIVGSSGDYNEVVGGVAIGSGSSFEAAGSTGDVTISGGTVKAYAAFGNGIGAGNSSASIGGTANIIISGGSIDATSIGGGSSQNGVGGKADVHISGDASITLEKGIGGGDSMRGTGGVADIIIDSGTLVCGDVIGGGNGAVSGNGGMATVTVNNGSLTAKSIGGGTGGEKGNGGAADIKINGGTIRTGSIGGGTTFNPSGNLGYAKANITAGDITGQFIMAYAGEEPCTFNMSGGVLHDVNTSDNSIYNYAKSNGAAVYMDDPNGSATISGGTIEKCHAQDGGAIYMSAGTFTISNTAIIQNCTATNNGGAVYLGGGNLNVNGGTINGNSAINGAGFYLSNVSGASTLKVTGGNVSGNTASNNGGGAMVDGGNVFVYGGTFKNNKAINNGGAIAINNGNFKMIDGSLDENQSVNGYGGALYVSSETSAVDVRVLSGAINKNTSAKSGGAIAVLGKEDGTHSINVQVGVKDKHYTYDSAGNLERINCEHSDDVNYDALDCPQIKGNISTINGGAIYMTGNDLATLNLYCVEESDSKVIDKNGQESNFMKVEGGNVNVSTSANEDEDSQDDLHGNISINNTIHVTGGKMHIWGSMDNPSLLDVITVDIKKTGDEFKDHRSKGEYYKLIYYENFTDPETNITTGQYKEFSIPHGSTHTILQNIYYHPGYTIDSWNTEKDGSITNEAMTDMTVQDPTKGKYVVNNTYTFDGNPLGDLTIYAIWNANGYPVEYKPNTEDYEGHMDIQNHTYDVEIALSKNQYTRVGYEFLGWTTNADGTGDFYRDEQMVKNLAKDFGAKVILYAKWQECNHDDTHEYIYTLENNNTVLRRTCSCKGKSDTVQLIASDVNYDLDAHYARVNYSSTTWRPKVTYKKDGSDFVGAPINAGKYTVSVSEKGKTASVTYNILKIKQDAPEKPVDYDTIKNEGNTKLYIKPVTRSSLVTSDPNGYECIPQYKIVYDNGTEIVDSGWINETIITVDSKEYAAYFDLNVALTNYHIYARFDECENYLASDATEANTSYFFDGDIELKVEPGFKVMHTITEASKNSNNVVSGIKIEVEAESGYFIPSDFDIQIETYVQNSDVIHTQQAIIKYVDGKQFSEYMISNIPEKCLIKINISDAVKIPTISSKLTEKEEYGTVEENKASITRVSAYTVNYKVYDFNKTYYSNISLELSNNLPVNTTIIMLDKMNNAYYSYIVKSETDFIPLDLFTKMGTAFTAYDYVNGDSELQFIIDFSDTVSGISNDFLDTKLKVAIRNEDKTRSTDVSNTVTTNLFNDYEYTLSVSDGVNTMQKVITYNIDVNDGVSSNMDNKDTSMILKPMATTQLPVDAQIKVIKNNVTRTYSTTTIDGVECFVIPLGTLSSSSMSVEFITKLDIIDGTSYTMNASWMVSKSKYDVAVGNATQLSSSKPLTFTYQKVNKPIIKVQGTDNTQLYNAYPTINIYISWKNVSPSHITEFVVMKKSESGEYTSTGIKQEFEVLTNEPSSRGFKLQANSSFEGEYYIEAYVMEGLAIVASSRFYFIVKEDEEIKVVN